MKLKEKKNICCNKHIPKECCNKYIPKGGIIMWSGYIKCIPKGWLLCNGKNGTPDLQDKFVIGCGKNNIGSIGGSSEISLTSENLAPHSHVYNNTREEAIFKLIQGGPTEQKITVIENIITTNITQDGPGNSKPFCILPPYYTVAFIIRI